MVIIPDESQVNPALFSEVAKELGKTSSDYDTVLPQSLITDFFIKNDVEYIGLLESFRRIGAKTRLYLIQDTHWNIEGNRLAADMIFNHPVDRKLVFVEKF